METRRPQASCLPMLGCLQGSLTQSRGTPCSRAFLLEWDGPGLRVSALPWSAAQGLALCELACGCMMPASEGALRPHRSQRGLSPWTVLGWLGFGLLSRAFSCTRVINRATGSLLCHRKFLSKGDFRLGRDEGL